MLCVMLKVTVGGWRTGRSRWIILGGSRLPVRCTNNCSNYTI